MTILELLVLTYMVTFLSTLFKFKANVYCIESTNLSEENLLRKGASEKELFPIDFLFCSVLFCMCIEGVNDGEKKKDHR